MARRTPSNSLRPYQPIEPDAYTAATVSSAGIDTIGFRSLLVMLNMGDLGTSATLAVKLQESDAIGSGYVDISGAAFPTYTQAGTDYSNTVKAMDLNLLGRKRYIRVVGVVAVATSDYGVSAVLMGPSQGVADMTRAAVGSEAACSVSYAVAA